MRKHISAIIASTLVLSVTHTVIAQHSHGEHPPSAGTAPSGAGSEQEEKQKYTCPMHPEVITNHPGNCPKCGMKLVPIKEKKRRTPNPPSQGSGVAGVQRPTPNHLSHASDASHEHEKMYPPSHDSGAA